LQIRSKLNALHIDHSIDSKAYDLIRSKTIKIQDYNYRYLETEKILTDNLNKLKEENNKALNEFAILTKKQNEVNDEMNKTTEELRKARIELSEFETTRLPNREYEIKQKKRIIFKN